uniref:Leucine-rich repeat-containing protein 72 n=1 Tax=Chelydra serpentina TaxID=8475 RepID=A0A8C3XQL3_CHESE
MRGLGYRRRLWAGAKGFGVREGVLSWGRRLECGKGCRLRAAPQKQLACLAPRQRHDQVALCTASAHRCRCRSSHWLRFPVNGCCGAGARGGGALKHLHALQILLLHNNQLKNLDTTVKELKGMISLQTLNLFRNPLSQDPGYRLYVTYFLPSVQLLDRKKVTQKERESALHIYNHERSRVLQSIGFGKRIDMPLVAKTVSTRSTPFTQNRISLSFQNVFSFVVPFENPEDAVFVRAMKRSIMEFSSVDWNKISTCLGIRLENKPEEPHEKLTVKFR